MKYFSIEELTRTNTGLDNKPNDEQQANLIFLADNLLDKARELYRKPIRVTSGFRSLAVNKKVGGVLSTNTFASATSLNNYLPLTGGTVTGNITAKHFIQQITISTPASGTAIDDYIDTLLRNNTYIKFNVNYWSSYAIHLYYLNQAIVGVPITVVISNTGSSNSSLYIYEKNNGSNIVIINKTLVPGGSTSTIRFQFIKFDDNNIIVTSAM